MPVPVAAWAPGAANAGEPTYGGVGPPVYAGGYGGYGGYGGAGDIDQAAGATGDGGGAIGASGTSGGGGAAGESTDPHPAQNL
jgi:hypothetical protein